MPDYSIALKEMGLPENLWKFDNDKYSGTEAAYEDVKYYIERMKTKYVPNSVGLFVFGESGSGKSMLGGLILVNALNKAISCGYCLFQETVDAYFGNNFAGAFRAVYRVPKILVVDSVDESPTGGGKRAMNALVRMRLDEGNPTVLLTPFLKTSEFAAAYGEQLWGRVEESSRLVRCSIGDPAKNHRSWQRRKA